MITADAVMAVLAGVRDPEIDEPLTDLGFVAGVDVDGSRVDVRLRLPTYFCAPNFAYLMAADALEAVRALPGVVDATVTLDDHFASGEINGAIAGGGRFADAFPGESAGGLGELRALFTRKAFTARQSRMCDRRLRAGRTFDELAALALRDLDDDPDVTRCIALRRQLGIDASTGAPAFVLADGSALEASGLERFMRIARLVRLSLEGNAGLCRSLLATRYGVPGPGDATA
ncbi:MAG TPA: iron-sulfur cluster assembly protein [Baekduia sp.]|uniref:iron-sulfur cluster assembly protein n=1 Tax=Baekduia sp. TaxID=2600305 RepID=UPI002BF3171C|nr:iron-sulfur cluster assembly protein [Baekduia sp.]HMJ36610.1 iron-sulfur cluster assembly protein [Baekduia sp.]